MKPSPPTSAHAIVRMLDEQLAGDDEMLSVLTRQADEILGAHDDLLARLRREIEAMSPSIAGAHHLRG